MYGKGKISCTLENCTLKKHNYGYQTRLTHMRYSNDYSDNELCEICWANNERIYNGFSVFDFYEINTHCIELRRNREARKHKNIQPSKTVF